MELKLKSEIIKAASAVKSKYRALKRGQIEEESDAQKRFEPLLKPLEKIIDLTKDNEDTAVTAPSVLSRKLKNQKIKKIGIKRRRLKKSSADFKTKHRIGEEEETENDHEATKFYDPEEIFESAPDEGLLDKSWENLHEYLTKYGPLTKEYITKKLTEPATKYDETFGVRPNLKDDTWWIGNKEISFDRDDFIFIGNERPIKGTRGLFELLFKKLPDTALFDESDREKYKKILLLTNGHKQGYYDDGKIASSHGKKYNAIISKLFPPSGRGLLPVTNNKIDYVHWDDPNELVERLALLFASREAGHGGHEAEIASIEEELREGNFIK